jgi:hypothetical protein
VKVVVGAQLQAHHAVGLVDAAGEHQDRHQRLLLAQAARDVHAVLAGQAQVEDHHVDGVARHRIGEFAAARHRGDAQFVGAQVIWIRLRIDGSSSSASTWGGRLATTSMVGSSSHTRCGP